MCAHFDDDGDAYDAQEDNVPVIRKLVAMVMVMMMMMMMMMIMMMTTLVVTATVATMILMTTFSRKPIGNADHRNMACGVQR